MIRIYASQTSENCEITIRGHAGYSMHNDIVCAAVSTLYYTLLEVLEKEAPLSITEKKEKKGKAYLRFISNQRTSSSFSTILTGLELIEAEFPENVKIIKRSTNL